MHMPRRAEGGIAAANVGVRPGNRYPRKPKQGDSPGVLRKIASGIAAPFEQMFAISQGDYAPLGVEWVDGEGWVQSPEKVIPFAADLAGMATTGALGAPPVAGAAGMGIRAYHGSPHDFDRFSMDKIGTGEGAQAYGHGLYFAENEGVARNYRDALQFKAPVQADGSAPAGPMAIVANAVRDARKYPEPERSDALRRWLDETEAMASGPYAPPDMLQSVKEARRLIDSGEVKPDLGPAGRMYEVDINASPDEFLDWDKPLSEQPAKVRDAFRSVAEQELAGTNAKRLALFRSGKSPWRTEAEATAGFKPTESLQQLISHMGDRQATEALRAAGIKGIRYLDAGSRNVADGPYWNIVRESDGTVVRQKMGEAKPDTPEGFRAEGPIDERSRNYVVFDDSTINILKKYGLAGLTAGGGAAALMSGGSDPASASQPEYTTGGKFAAGGRTPRMATGGIADAAQMRVTVQKGDNPSRIAKRILGAGASGTEVQALANAIVAANGIKNDRRIQIGESLIIPGQTAPEVDMPTPRTRASGIAAQANASYRPEADKPTGLSANPRRDAMAKGLAGIGAPNPNDGGWTPYFQMTRGMNQREAIANEVDQRLRDANLMDNPSPGMKGRPFTTPYSGMPAIDSMRVSPSMSVRVKENMDIGTKPNADIPETFSQVSGLPDMNAGKFPPDFVPGLLPLQNVPVKGTSPTQLSLGAMPGSIENTASRFAEPPKRSLPDGATTGEHFTDDRPLFMPGVSSSLGHGLIKSPVPGRTDQLPLTVPKDSYIVPADVISGLGQGNTDAGWPLLKRILAARGADIDEGAPVTDGGVEIIAAGGEGVIHPEIIAALGGGDVRQGHRLLDDIVLSVRKQTAKRLNSLPGPKR